MNTSANRISVVKKRKSAAKLLECADANKKERRSRFNRDAALKATTAILFRRRH